MSNIKKIILATTLLCLPFFAMAGAIGFFTAVADMMTHPTHFGGPSTEAIVTGVGAGLLCLTMSKVWSK